MTSNIVPTVWRVDPLTYAVTVHPLALDADTTKDVGFSAIVYSAEHDAYFAASDVHGTLWRIDTQLATADKLRLDARLPRGCALAVDRRVAAPAEQLCLTGARQGWIIEVAKQGHAARVHEGSCSSRRYRER